MTFLSDNGHRVTKGKKPCPTPRQWNIFSGKSGATENHAFKKYPAKIQSASTDILFDLQHRNGRSHAVNVHVLLKPDANIKLRMKQCAKSDEFTGFQDMGLPLKPIQCILNFFQCFNIL
jgi:hypothetical protein